MADNNGLLGGKIVAQTRDPAFDARGAAPNFGRFPVSHARTFAGVYSTAANVYLRSDEALIESLENARNMRKDVGVMECLEARQRATALLDWHLEPEDEKDQRQIELCARLTKIVERIGRFTEYRRNLLEAIWYGRSAVQHRYRWLTIGGRRYVVPGRVRDNPGWKPIHGDKLVWRFDRYPGDPLADQLGIRVWGGGYTAGGSLAVHAGGKTREAKVEATDRGLAYFLAPYERDLIAIHKHTIEDAEFEEPRRGGRIHGVGIRDRIYYDWLQKQEILAFLMEFLERSAGGIRIWTYPDGNDEALKKAQAAAIEVSGGAKTDLFFPRPIGEDGLNYDLQVIEPGMGGVDTLHNLLTDYFGHRIKRYILGQVLTTEAQATGLGSGVADAHMDSFMQIVSYDSNNLDETITEELIENLKNWNFPEFRDVRIRFVSNVESEDVEKKLEALEKAWNMGTRISESAVLDTIGLAAPTADERALENKSATADPSAMMGGMLGGGGSRADTGGPPGDDAGDNPDGDSPRDGSPSLYAFDPDQPRDESGRWTGGRVNGYAFDEPGSAPTELAGDPTKIVGAAPVISEDRARLEAREVVSEGVTIEQLTSDVRDGLFDPASIVENADKARRAIDRWADRYADDDDEINGEHFEDHAARLYHAWLPSPEEIAEAVFSDPRRHNRRYENTGSGRWVTLNANSGEDGDGGTPVFIDGDGTIKAGPKSLEGKDLDNLSGKRKSPTRKKGSKAAQPPGTRKTKDGRVVGATQLHYGDLSTDPKRFQYKFEGIGEEGVTDELKGVKKFNPMLGGQILAWRDPADGKNYVVNGHHRHELARRSGEHEGWDGDLPTYFVDAKDAKEARALGALANIAEGRGTAVDAAKFLRDTGGDVSSIYEEHGISIKGNVARDANILTNLSDSLFDRLATGGMEKGRALAIASELDDHDKQQELIGTIEKTEAKRGKTLTDGSVREMARMMDLSRTTQAQGGLFDDFAEKSSFVERGELMAHLRRQLTSERSTFKQAASTRRQTALESTGTNRLDVEGNRERAKSAELALWDFDTRANARGDELATTISDAAEELANAPRKRKSIEKRLVETVRGILGRGLSSDAGANRPAGADAERHARQGRHRQPRRYSRRDMIRDLSRILSAV